MEEGGLGTPEVYIFCAALLQVELLEQAGCALSAVVDRACLSYTLPPVGVRIRKFLNN